MKHALGDLVYIDMERKFPVSLRDGPGYTFARTEAIDPGEIAVILKQEVKNDSTLWIKIYVAEKEKIGWIPASMINSTIKKQ